MMEAFSVGPRASRRSKSIGAIANIIVAGWRPLATWRNPLVWVLHASYAWLVIGLLLMSAAAMGWVVPSLAAHALGVGLIGGLIIGMITRTALGHTGRMLIAGTGGDDFGTGLVLDQRGRIVVSGSFVKQGGDRAVVLVRVTP